MEPEFIQDRIARLRLQKGVSEYSMSYALGHNKGYINHICAGKAMPSMVEFLAICDYLEVTPREFFDEDNPDPHRMKDVTQKFLGLSAEDLILVEQLIDRLKKK